MADVSWAIHMAVLPQTGIGVVNATLDATTTSATTSDGLVLGDADSGDAGSGITIPNFERITKAVADIGLTKQFDTFLRTAVSNLAITIPLKGNGVVSTPSAGQALPLAGVDALLQAAGFVSANGSSPTVNYTPRISATSPSTRYVTVKIWIGSGGDGMSWELLDCICESAAFELTPGGLCLATFSVAVGSVDEFNTGLTLGTFDYGTQATLSAPVVQGVAAAWAPAGTLSVSPDHGFSTLTITSNQSIEDIPDANQAAGVRKIQTERSFDVAGTMFGFSGDEDAHYQNLIQTTAPTGDLVFQVGTIAGAAQTINAYRFDVRNIQLSSVKPNKAGSVLTVEIEGHCTGLTEGSEFELRFN